MTKEVYDVTVGLGGTITGEHGIGKIRVESLNEYLEGKAIEKMKKKKSL